MQSDLRPCPAQLHKEQQPAFQSIIIGKSHQFLISANDKAGLQRSNLPKILSYPSHVYSKHIGHRQDQARQPRQTRSFSLACTTDRMDQAKRFPWPLGVSEVARVRSRQCPFALFIFLHVFFSCTTWYQAAPCEQEMRNIVCYADWACC
jgi:hypothetical protein